MNDNGEIIRDAEWMTLDPDESVVAWGHPSIVAYALFYVIGGLIAVSGLFIPFVSSIGFGVSLLVVLMGVILVLTEHYRRVTIFYVLTTERVIIKRGILNHDIDKIHYSEVQKTDKTNPIWGRILGGPGETLFGTVSFETASSIQGDIRMPYVPSPNEVTSVYSEHKE